MQPVREELRELEVDQFQRYVAVAHILLSLHREAGVAQVLDLGSGPHSSLAAFLPADRFAVRRADVQDFAMGDASFLRLVPGQPIPAPDAAFEFVVALDVLEHVPSAARAAWVADADRVAKHALVLTVPNGVPEVVRSEAMVDAGHERQNGAPHPFLVEHFAFGLPGETAVRGLFASTRKALAVYAVHPLSRWLASLMLQQRLLTVQGGQEACKALNRLCNTEVHFWPRAVLCYRKVYVAVAGQELRLALPQGDLGDGVDAELADDDPLDELARLAASLHEKGWQDLTAALEREGYWRAESLSLHDRWGKALSERDGARGDVEYLRRALAEAEAGRAALGARVQELSDDLARIAESLGAAPAADRAALCALSTELQRRLASELREGTRRFVRLRPRRLAPHEQALVDRFPPDEHCAP